MSSTPHPSVQLTRYPVGSLRELWAIVWPLMISSISGTIMITIDRAILASYGSEAFDACAAAQPWYWAIETALMAFILSSEIVIGRFNGAERYQRIGPAVWQMITLAFSTYLFLIPIAFHTSYLFADNIAELGAPYLKVLLLTEPFELAGCGAIGAFFVGRGETSKIPWVVASSCVLNVILDFWFVFGGLGIPSMGIIGAALGTNVANMVAFLTFLALFLRKRYREHYAIHSYRWSWDVLHQCFKNGFPNALSALCNTTGWALVYQFFAKHVLYEHYKAYCVAVTVYSSMFFVTDALGKGVGTLCANLLGAGAAPMIGKVLKQSVHMVGIFALLFLPLIFFFADPVIRFFGSETFATNQSYYQQAQLFIHWYWVVFICEALRFSVQGFLFSLFKARAILTAHIVLYWCVDLIPMYFLVRYWHWNPVLYTKLFIIENLLILIGFYVWFRKKTWCKTEA